MNYDTTLPPLDLDLDLAELERRIALTPKERIQRGGGHLRDWVRKHATDLAILTALVVTAAVVHARGMYDSPARFDDEGTYTAYAWAVQNMHQLGHYTYWYAHPPLGWIQMAAWNWVTDSFNRAPYAVAAERQLMLVCKLISIVVMYGLALRLRMSRGAAVAACAAFALSPLAVYFDRMALLDNIVTPWLLGSFYCAASPRRSLPAAVGAAVCFAVAVLSKETALLFLPALLLLMWQCSDKRNRRFAFTMFTALLVLIGALYPLYALIKNELLEGPGHVSLEWAIKWQLFDRQGSGSILDSKSTAYNVVHGWLALDPLLPKVALIALPFGLLFRRTRAIALAFGIQAASLLRGGYLPYPFVIALIPFAILTVAGVLDGVWQSARVEIPAKLDLVRLGGIFDDRGAQRSALRPTMALSRLAGTSDHRHAGWASARRRGAVAISVVARLAVIGSVAALIVLFYSPWRATLHDLQTRDRDAGKAAALAWIEANVSHDQVIVVDDSLWVDLVRAGYSPDRVIWFTKLDVDKDVRLPKVDGWKSVDYVIVDHQDELSLHLTTDGKASPATIAQFPTLGQAILHSTVVAGFGSDGDTIAVRQVHPNAQPKPK